MRTALRVPCALVVDDSRTMREILVRALTGLGWSASAVADGPAALRHLAATGEPDLLVTDSVMPGLSGAELVREVRRASPVRVLLITADSSTDGVLHALRAGADEYLMKPFTSDALASKLALLGFPVVASVP